MRVILPVVVIGALALCSSAQTDPPEQKTSSGVICPKPFVVCTEDANTCCTSSDGGFTQDGNITLMHTEPRGCPPAQLYNEPLGTFVCKTECCSPGSEPGAEGNGKCNLGGNKVAITPEGWRTTLPPFDTGVVANNERKVYCYMRTAPKCVFSATRDATSGSNSCGLEFKLAVVKLNENGETHPIVQWLNESLSVFLSASVEESTSASNTKMRRISAKFDEDKAREQVEKKREWFNTYCDTVAPTEAELNAMSKEDREDEAKELKACKDKAKKEAEDFVKGKKFTVTWGYLITAWSYVSEDDTFTYNWGTAADPVYKSRTFTGWMEDDDATAGGMSPTTCFKVNNLPEAKDFYYNEAKLMFVSCLQNCQCPKLPRIPGCKQRDGYPCAASALSTSTMLAMVATLITLSLSW